MGKKKKKALEAKGWKSVSVAEFLELATAEETIIEVRLAFYTDADAPVSGGAGINNESF